MQKISNSKQSLALCVAALFALGACAAAGPTGVQGAGPMGPTAQPNSIAYVPNGISQPARPVEPNILVLDEPTPPAPPVIQAPAPPVAPMPPAAPVPQVQPPSAPASTTVDFTFQVGDQLEVSIWNEKELTTTHTVMRDGTVPAKAVGNVAVVGRTLEAVRGELTERYSGFLVDPRVSIRVISVYSERVFVLGEVTKPAAIALGGRTTVMQAISQAGGFTPGVADMSTIRIVRKGNGPRPRVITHNAESVLNGRGGQMNLMPGDVVYVHPTGLANWSRRLTALLGPIGNVVGSASGVVAAVAVADGN